MKEAGENRVLSSLMPGEDGEVLDARDAPTHLKNMGFISGTKVKSLQRSLFGDPTAFLVRGAVIALRKKDTEKIRLK